MHVYVIGFLLTAVLIYFTNYYRKEAFNHRNSVAYGTYKAKYFIILFITIIPLALISGLRYDVGTDYMYTYYPNFYLILEGKFHYSEFGFTYLNKIIGFFTDDATWLFVITSFIFIYCLIKGILEYSPNVIVSVLVVFLSLIYFTSLNNVRQLIAVAILFLGFKYLIKNDFSHYIIYILLAFLFHVTALIGIVFYIGINLKFIRHKFLTYALIGIIITLLFGSLFPIIIYKTKYAYFLNSYLTNNERTFVNLLYSFTYLVIAYLFLYKSIKKNKMHYALLIFQYLFFIWQLLSFFIPASEVIMRMSQYEIVYQCILIPILIKTQGSLKKNIAPWLVLLFYIITYGIYFYHFIIVQGYHSILPYQSIFIIH